MLARLAPKALNPIGPFSGDVSWPGATNSVHGTEPSGGDLSPTEGWQPAEREAITRDCDHAKTPQSDAPAKHGGCHLFRHTQATVMPDAGAEMRYLAEMLGHQKLETTMIYTRA